MPYDLLRVWDWLRDRRERQEPGTEEFKTLPWDNVPWDIKPVPGRVIAVGDIHGDLPALGAILEECGIIDPTGKWKGGSDHLVLLGDLVGGNADSRLLLNFVMRLEAEAKLSAGGVHALLGNHDLLPVQGDLRGFRRREKKLFKKFPVEGSKSKKARDAFRGDSVYARWIRGRNAILKIGKTLFVHAGIDRWALETDPGGINATVRAWIRHWQGIDEKPEKSTRWTVGVPDMNRGSRFEVGPLWIRSYKAKSSKRPDEGPSEKKLDKILEHWSVERMIVGHAPVSDGEVLLDHPYYGDKVIMIDTRISDKKRGRISAVELKQDKLEAIYSQHPKKDLLLRRRELARLEGETLPGGWRERWTSWWDRSSD